ncbi:MAG: hypothetical protein P8Y45_17205 [Exilibacterium sp.]
MQISSITQTYGVPHNRSDKSVSVDKIDDIKSGEINSDTVTISRAGQRASEQLQTIANKYDVTNISTTERIAMTQELHDNHLIPKDVMIFMMAPLSMNEDMDHKSNYLSTIRESFEVASKMGDSAEQLELKRQRLEILEQLSAISHNGSNP